MKENGFKALGLEDKTLKAIEAMNFEAPTEVQSASIPGIIEGKDLVVMAKTGSGKTLAYTTPMFNVIDCQLAAPQGLILVPTRELAIQVHKEVRKLGKYHAFKSTCVYGQHNIETEIDQLEKGCQIIVGTPGRVIDHLQRKTIKNDHIKYLVLDEADRMLDMGFIDQVMSIVHELPKDRMTQMFSATMPDPVKKLSEFYMKSPTFVEISSDTMTVDKIDQYYYRVDHNKKRTTLAALLKIHRDKRLIIFANTRSEVDRIAKFLDQKGYNVASLHGANTQSHRIRTIEKLKKGKVKIVVATDVAARGLHVDDLQLVINYDLPNEKENYVHRIGRTGRAGKDGTAISLVTVDDVFALYEIEELTGQLIEEKPLPEIKRAQDYKKRPVEKRKREKERVKRPYESKEHLKERLLKDEKTVVKTYKSEKKETPIKRVSAPKKASFLQRVMRRFKK